MESLARLSNEFGSDKSLNPEQDSGKRRVHSIIDQFTFDKSQNQKSKR